MMLVSAAFGEVPKPAAGFEIPVRKTVVRKLEAEGSVAGGELRV